MLPRRKIAYIWMSRKRIYVLKVHRNWYGACIHCQGSTLECRDGWQEHQESLKKQIRRATDVYGLEEYELHLLVSGTNLICKTVNIPAKNKKEARSMVVWEELIGDGSRLYSFDVHMRKHDGSERESMPEWLVAAYPHDLISDILNGFQQQGCFISEIDALPALAGRFVPDGKGILYIYESSQVHVIMLHKGEPLAYTCAEKWPQEEMRQLHHFDVGDQQDEIMLWHDEINDVWKNKDFSSKGQNAQRWDLNGVLALLTAF